ncbi:hypothetical protein vseg_015264 [Gypsophila vaccaria]
MKKVAASILSKANAKSIVNSEGEEEIIEEAAVAKVVMVNTTMEQGNHMLFQEHKDWSGYRVGPQYPATIHSGDLGRFLHMGLYLSNPEGSIGEVVYVGNTVPGKAHNCAWLLAWNNPGYNNPSMSNQVYVEVGHISKYGEGQINWDEIKSKLLNSSQESYYEDVDTGGKAYAEVGNTPLVVIPAIFGVL